MNRSLAAALIVLLLSALPFPVFSAEPAGFAPGAIWFSKLPLYSNKKVTVYSALYNGTGNKLSGRLEFLDLGSVFGGNAFSLEAGASNIISTEWTPEEGSHSVSARIADAVMITENGERIPIDLENVTVAAIELIAVPAPALPLPSAVNHADTKAAEVFLGKTAPMVLPIVSPILGASDALRDKGVEALAKSINELRGATEFSKAELVSPATSASTTQSALSTASSSSEIALSSSGESSRQIASVSGFTEFLAKLWLYIQYGFYYTLKYSYLYYPIVALMFFIMIRLLYSRLVARR